MKPRKNPLIIYNESSKRDITFHTKDLEAETSGIIDGRGFLYVGANYAGKSATVVIHRDQL